MEDYRYALFEEILLPYGAIPALDEIAAGVTQDLTLGATLCQLRGTRLCVQGA